jgi:hypothetical protein
VDDFGVHVNLGVFGPVRVSRFRRSQWMMDRSPQSWFRVPVFLQDPVVQIIVGLVLLLAVSLIALYGLSRLRSINAHNLQIDDIVRKNFEEMRTEGDLNDQEFRKIEALLAKNTSNDQRPESTNQHSSDA